MCNFTSVKQIKTNIMTTFRTAKNNKEYRVINVKGFNSYMVSEFTTSLCADKTEVTGWHLICVCNSEKELNEFLNN